MTNSADHARKAMREFERMVTALEEEEKFDLMADAEDALGTVDEITGAVQREA